MAVLALAARASTSAAIHTTALDVVAPAWMPPCLASERPHFVSLARTATPRSPAPARGAAGGAAGTGDGGDLRVTRRRGGATLAAMAGRRFERYVALGDSSTEGLDDPDGRGGYRGWADRLAERIAAHQGGLAYANLGVRGRCAREVRAE